MLKELDPMEYEKEIIKYCTDHDISGMTPDDIAYEIVKQAIDNTKWAEDAYPGIKERILNALDKACRKENENEI